jgi:hypothetical protein
VLSDFNSEISQSSSSEESDNNQTEFMSSNDVEEELAKKKRKMLSGCTGEKICRVKFSEIPPRYIMNLREKLPLIDRV